MSLSFAPSEMNLRLVAGIHMATATSHYLQSDPDNPDYSQSDSHYSQSDSHSLYSRSDS